ncbi:MAG: hypothetical protein PVI33_01580 [Candidatus Omnitrophota bacterium]
MNICISREGKRLGKQDAGGEQGKMSSFIVSKIPLILLLFFNFGAIIMNKYLLRLSWK